MFQNSSGNSDDEDTEDSDEEDSMETGNSTPRVARKRKQVCYRHLTSFSMNTFLFNESCLVSKSCPETETGMIMSPFVKFLQIFVC